MFPFCLTVLITVYRDLLSLWALIVALHGRFMCPPFPIFNYLSLCASRTINVFSNIRVQDEDCVWFWYRDLNYRWSFELLMIVLRRGFWFCPFIVRLCSFLLQEFLILCSVALVSFYGSLFILPLYTIGRLWSVTVTLSDRLCYFLVLSVVTHLIMIACFLVHFNNISLAFICKHDIYFIIFYKYHMFSCVRTEIVVLFNKEVIIIM